jgi:hypothetical protein
MPFGSTDISNFRHCRGSPPLAPDCLYSTDALAGTLQSLQFLFVNLKMKARDVVKLIEKTDGSWFGRKEVINNINTLLKKGWLP